MWNSGWSAWEGRLEDGNKCRSLWHAIHTHNTRIQRKDNETLTLKRQLINDSYTSSRMNVLPTFECLIRSPSFCWDWLSLSLSLSLSQRVLLHIEEIVVETTVIVVCVAPKPKVVVEVVAKVHEIAEDHVVLLVVALALTFGLVLVLLLLLLL